MAAEKEVTNIKAYLKVPDHSDGCGVVKDHGDEFKVLYFENEVNVPYNEASGKATGATHFAGFKVTIPFSKGAMTLMTDLDSNKVLDKIELTTVDINNEAEAALKATYEKCQLIGHTVKMGSSKDDASTEGFEATVTLVFNYTDLKYEMNSGEGTAKSSASTK